MREKRMAMLSQTEVILFALKHRMEVNLFVPLARTTRLILLGLELRKFI